jgi:KipI family sensor histidine kinase inhibitor
MAFLLNWASEYALLLSFGEAISVDAHHSVVRASRAIRSALAAARLPGIRDLHPGYCTLLITIDPGTADPERVEAALRRVVGGNDADPVEVPARTIEIPVCYAEEFAPDLVEVARRAGIAPAEAAHRHAAADYRVYFLGFAPGFPYLGGLPKALAAPRLPVPRRRVPAGSVAIAGAQAGIYPFEMPGGWRLVGRTPLRLFDVEHDPPALLAPGNQVRFVAISAGEFRARVEA